MSREPILSRHDLRPSEKRFLDAMQVLGYGRFEWLHIHRGELVLDPWPTSIRTVKFGTATSNQPAIGSEGFELKKEIVDFFAHVRSTDRGEIRVLEVRGGLPFSMEIEGGGLREIA